MFHSEGFTVICFKSTLHILWPLPNTVRQHGGQRRVRGEARQGGLVITASSLAVVNGHGPADKLHFVFWGFRLRPSFAHGGNIVVVGLVRVVNNNTRVVMNQAGVNNIQTRCLLHRRRCRSLRAGGRGRGGAGAGRGHCRGRGRGLLDISGGGEEGDWRIARGPDPVRTLLLPILGNTGLGLDTLGPPQQQHPPRSLKRFQKVITTIAPESQKMLPLL